MNFFEFAQKNKIYIFGFIAVLLIAIAIGIFYFSKVQNSSSRNPEQQNNNSLTDKYKQYSTGGQTESGDASVSVKAQTSDVQKAGCPIRASKPKKGKIAYYHVPGDLSYNKIKNPICFKTEQDAISAGYKKSPR